MNEVNINKYLSQFNPILIVPVLSAVVGAILVFLFGFKRPNEPRFQSSIDSIKKSKKSKKTIDSAVPVANKKVSVTKIKTEEKKSENGSPTKKTSSKKNVKELTNSIPKKSKTSKNNSADVTDSEKPADFDDIGWFTVQSKQSKNAKQKNKIDDSTVNHTENSSPKVQSAKNNKTAKSSKTETKQTSTQVTSNNTSEVSLPEQQSTVDQSFNVTKTQAVEPVLAIKTIDGNGVVAKEEKKSTATIPLELADPNTVVENAIVFDELGEWTKPDRKRANKKKLRKDI